MFGLSTLSSVYDPLGFIAPLILVGRQILQQMCRNQTDWDSPLPESLLMRWRRWRDDLFLLQTLKIQRCYKPDKFGVVQRTELHHFSDASTDGYGQCSYLRLVDDQQRVHCSLVMGKARVAPLKTVTIPRLELTAALVSVKVSALLQRELDLSNVTEVFWTDSSVVLGYISNDSRRFHVFVANRVQQIRDHTEPSQWKHVSTTDNPADVASRGITADDLLNRSMWFTGPDFLWKADPILPSGRIEIVLSPDDPEIKRVQTFSANTDEIPTHFLLERLEYFSDWHRAKKAIAACLTFKAALKLRSVKKPQNAQSLQTLRKDRIPMYQAVEVEDLRQAELEIIRLVQMRAFETEIKTLQSLKIHEDMSDRKVARNRNKTLKHTSSIYRLDPFLDVHGIMRVGGRIHRAELSSNIRHPAILPRKAHITNLVIRHFHEQSEHQGRGMTTNEIRENGFWIIGCSSAVSEYIFKCVKCRKLRSQLQQQKMANLPEDRLEPAPPFTFSGVDFFGPWVIKEGRKLLKRYGVIFTCMACRAIHLETANSLDTDSFINALRRFLALRGPMRQLRSDRGTNFVGAERELREAVAEMDDDRIRQFLLKEGCDFFEFKMNVPSASHMGGVWERQIRSVRNVLASLLEKHGSQLDDESLRTLMCEAAAIVNSRPLTVDNLNDPTSLEPLTPNHLLTMKSKIILPPPGEFQRVDLYSRKRWRRVQYLANEFWSRWRKEFLQNLQPRTKWVRPRRNMRIDDIVLVKDENLPRNEWRLGRIVEAHLDEDGHLRKVRVSMGDPSLDAKGRRIGPIASLERPIHKLVLLLENE